MQVCMCVLIALVLHLAELAVHHLPWGPNLAVTCWNGNCAIDTASLLQKITGQLAWFSLLTSLAGLTHWQLQQNFQSSIRLCFWWSEDISLSIAALLSPQNGASWGHRLCQRTEHLWSYHFWHNHFAICKDWCAIELQASYLVPMLVCTILLTTNTLPSATHLLVCAVYELQGPGRDGVDKYFRKPYFMTTGMHVYPKKKCQEVAMVHCTTRRDTSTCYAHP